MVGGLVISDHWRISIPIHHALSPSILFSSFFFFLVLPLCFFFFGCCLLCGLRICPLFAPFGFFRIPRRKEKKWNNICCRLQLYNNKLITIFMQQKKNQQEKWRAEKTLDYLLLVVIFFLLISSFCGFLAVQRPFRRFFKVRFLSILLKLWFKLFKKRYFDAGEPFSAFSFIYNPVRMLSLSSLAHPLG